MEVIEIIKLIISIISWVAGGVGVIYGIVKNIKEKKIKNWEQLRAELKKEIIPLCEQAERALKDPTERQDWVIKKLSDRCHIDFYKYKNILELAIGIIKEICETTKIEVNKTIIIKEKDENKQEQSDGGLTNGIS